MLPGCQSSQVRAFTERERDAEICTAQCKYTRRGYWPSERTFNMALLGFCRRGGNGSKATNCSNLNRATATVPCLRQGKWLLATALLREMRRSEIQFSPLECWEKVWRLENSTAQELFSGPWHHFLHHVHFSHEAGTIQRSRVITRVPFILFESGVFMGVQDSDSGHFCCKLCSTLIIWYGPLSLYNMDMGEAYRDSSSRQVHGSHQWWCFCNWLQMGLVPGRPWDRPLKVPPSWSRLTLWTPERTRSRIRSYSAALYIQKLHHIISSYSCLMMEQNQGCKPMRLLWALPWRLVRRHCSCLKGHVNVFKWMDSFQNKLSCVCSIAPWYTMILIAFSVFVRHLLLAQDGQDSILRHRLPSKWNILYGPWRAWESGTVPIGHAMFGPFGCQIATSNWL